MSAKQQTERLANYIMAEIPGEPSRSEGAGDTAVRLLKEYRVAFQYIVSELGVPCEDYPAVIANAWQRAEDMLAGQTPLPCP